MPANSETKNQRPCEYAQQYCHGGKCFFRDHFKHFESKDGYANKDLTQPVGPFHNEEEFDIERKVLRRQADQKGCTQLNGLDDDIDRGFKRKLRANELVSTPVPDDPIP